MKIIKKIINYYEYLIHNLVMSMILEFRVRFFKSKRQIKRKHCLPGDLIISLTSYPPRFKKLDLTLKCLLSQNLAADHIILWIAESDKDFLTEPILNLQKNGLEIAFYKDLRSYKKFIPTLKYYKNCFLVTADDDLFYWPTWLEELVDEHKVGSKEIVCHRAHTILRGENNLPLSYLKWGFDAGSSISSSDIFPTSGGGVLYPPGCFYSDVFNEELFLRLAPNADDIWLYWMMRLQGYKARRISKHRRFYSWLFTQQIALWRTNLLCGDNDLQIKSMISYYGFPGSKEN